MACKKIVAAATCVLVLSLNLISDVEGVKCPPHNSFVRSRIGSCGGGDRWHCKGRCQLEGYAGGICDARDICYCIQTDSSSGGKLNGDDADGRNSVPKTDNGDGDGNYSP